MSWQVKKEVLFERSLPEARWSCFRYAPEPPKAKEKPKREWRLKSAA